MLTAGAADGNGDVAAVVEHQGWQPALQEGRPVLQIFARAALDFAGGLLVEALDAGKVLDRGLRDILDRDKARLTGDERLILQPNGGEEPLRQWLMDNGYRILHEEVLRENRFNYEIIVAERSGPMRYSTQELYFGPLQLQERSPAFLAKWQRLLQLKQRTLTHFAQARQAVPEDKVQALTRQTRWISELLAQKD